MSLIRNDEKSKTTARLTQRDIFKTIFLQVQMLLTYKNEITILYSGECRNTYFEIKRSGGNDEQNK